MKGVGHQVAVAEHHPFRGAGRAAGVEQPREGVLGYLLPQRNRLALSKQLLVVAGQLDHLLDDRCQRTRVAVSHQDPRPGILDRVFQLGIGMARVQRNDHQSGRRDGHVQLQVAMAVAGDHGDTVAVHEAQRTQAALRRLVGVVGRFQRRVSQTAPVVVGRFLGKRLVVGLAGQVLAAADEGQGTLHGGVALRHPRGLHGVEE